MIRVGLVGAGPWAGMFTAPMLTSATGLELSSVWARRPDAAGELAGRFGATAAPSFDELLARCDAVAFNVPPDVQPGLAVRAAAAGKHLLLEKPLAFTVEDAEAIATAADAAAVATQLMLTYRFTPAVRAFLLSLDGVAVRHVRTSWVAGLAGSPFATPWRQMDGSAVYDVGPHALDLLEAAGGVITQIRAAESGGVTAVSTRHEGGAIGEMTLSVNTPGTRGPLEGVALTDAGRFLLPDPTPDPPDAVYQAITDEFMRTIEGGEQPIGVHRGVHVQRLIAAVFEALRTGELVDI